MCVGIGDAEQLYRGAAPTAPDPDLGGQPLGISPLGGAWSITYGNSIIFC
jgi:hypothetical protein